LRWGFIWKTATALRGNVYKMTGTVSGSLAWSPVLGRLFSLEVETQAGKELVPVLVPIEFNHVNMQKGQQFQMQIEVGERGILRAKDLRKT
jgi:hypothetical protein